MEHSHSNFLTVDVEEYYHVNYAGCDPSVYAGERTNLPRLVDRLLEIFATARVRCTFFVLGVIGEKYPEVVRSIHAACHEVASHGCNHRGVREMSAAEFTSDVLRSCGILESLTGEKVSGFRAPSFSVDRETMPRFYGVLHACGLEYSSSVFPGRTFLYGVPGFPIYPHQPVFGGSPTRIVEFPITGFGFLGRRLPLYLRMLSAPALERKIHKENSNGRPAVLYVHPREIDPDQPRLPIPRWQALLHYWGIRGCEAKLCRLLNGSARFCTMREYIVAGGVSPLKDIACLDVTRY